MPLEVVTAPAEEPLTLADAKAHLRVSSGAEDGYIETLITAARNVAESYTGRAFIPRSLRYRLDFFPRELLLPVAPVQAVTQIDYVDYAGATQTLAAEAYQVDVASTPARIRPAYQARWPCTRAVLNAVTVLFDAGYAGAGSPEDSRAGVPAEIRQAMLLHIGHLYQHREDVIVGTSAVALPHGWSDLLRPLRLQTVV